MPRTPLEPWILARIGFDPAAGLTPRQAIDRYQLRQLRETIDYARRLSPFYRRRLAGLEGRDITGPEALSRIPFTWPGDIQADDLGFLCVSRGGIERVVTLASSGTTAPAKRIHFSADDLELTVDFFCHGMATMVQAGERVLILMPGELPGSVGDLLEKGLARLGVSGIVHGLVRDGAAVLEEIVSREIDCLVGLPVQLLSLARHPHAMRVPAGRLKSILLSADYVPDAIVSELELLWDVPVFNHYGMTEMGLGGGVECFCRCGYHLREADLFWEVVDPRSGRRLEPGQLGEVVFTTLTRTGMPLIRYRTGDLARFLPEPCPCGTVLQRLERVSGRIGARVRLRGGETFCMAELDEALFSLPFMLNYQPVLGNSCVSETLDLKIATCGLTVREASGAISRALLGIPAIGKAVAAGRLSLGRIEERAINPVSGSIKRSIEDTRKEFSC
jgi:phenylacetate-coenzyme A ligase PaaK-like adenylate-forming protein